MTTYLADTNSKKPPSEIAQIKKQRVKASSNLYKRYFFLIVLILYVVFKSSTFAHAKDVEKNALDKIIAQGVLKVCTEAGYLPLEMKSASGIWLGFDPDMMQAFVESISTKNKTIRLVILDTKWDGIIPSLMTKHCDAIASSMAITKERQMAVSFSEPYYKNALLISTKNTTKNKEKYKRISDFNKNELSIAVKTGSAPDLFLQNSKILIQANFLRYDADADTLGAVLNGRADAFIYDTPYVRLASLNNPGKLYIIPEGFNGDEFAVAFRKQDKELLERFNIFLANWKNQGKEKGSYEERLNYYFNGQDWVPLLSK